MKKFAYLKFLVFLICFAVPQMGFCQAFIPDQQGYIQNPLFKALIKKKGYQLVLGFKLTDRKTQKYEADAILNNKAITINNKGEVVQEPLFHIERPSESQSNSDIVLISAPDDRKIVSSQYEQLYINGKFGTQHKTTKNPALPAIYDGVTFLENEYVKIKKEGKVGLALRSGKVLIEPNYDFVEMSRSKQSQYYHVGQNGKHGLLDNNFKIAIPIIYDFLQACYSCNDSPNIYLVTQSRKYGVIKTNGNIILPTKYNNITFLMPGIIRVGIGKNKYGIADSTGKMLADTIFSSIMPRSDTKAIELKTADMTPKKGLMSFNGKIIIQPIYDQIGSFENGSAQIWLNDKRGLITENGKIILEPIYEQVFYRKPYYTIKSNGKYGVVSGDGKKLIPIDYDLIYPFDNNFYYEKAGTKGLMTVDKKVIKSIKYQEVIPANQFLIISENKKYGVLDASGNMIIPIIYDCISDSKTYFFHNGFIEKAEKDGKFYMLDRYGNEYDASLLIRN